MLCSNLINDYDSISFLFLCPRLESLVLLGNPVAEEPEYREEEGDWFRSLFCPWTEPADSH